ncbi:MAG: FecR domain-containing protein [Chloroflexi bacterium]|nr:FecR domain-containing protein [Chloroflexota bacterium]
MNWTFSRLIIVPCLLMMIVGAYPQQVYAEPALQELPNLAAVLEVTTDGVEILPNGTNQWIEISGRSVVSAGDSIRTDNTGVAFLVWFEDGTLVEIEPNSQLYINEFKGTTADSLFSIEVTLVVGRIFNTVNHLVDPNSRYSINTPTMQTSVRGTVFGVDVSPSLETTLAVTQGAVAVTQGTPASVLLEVNEGFWVRSSLKEPFGTPLSFAEANNDAVVLALIAGGQSLQSGGMPLSTPEPADGTPQPATTAEPISGTGPASTPEANDSNNNSNANDDHGGSGNDDNTNSNDNANDDHGGSGKDG